ncbi:LPS export ABC transporter permease LptF [Dongia sedimenti]|uniref:Lipopolysaccharide export system permease protein LptF n=1 Tax=Dongia sedimenti TaxID=3064282 RepID=A0ABU0YJR1_9PROT|nr:LPS export ABC transporter permease LptF [Rhodospirillaceae bacterium R-7]
MRLIDAYILRRVLMPLLAAVGIAMAALLMQRLIHLLDLFANRGSPLSIILKMLGNLVPFYLGIALPAALFIGVLYAGSRLSSESELDAMRASGLSLLRLIAPVLALAVVLVMISSYLLGWLQPYTRFGYRALVHLVTDTQWDSAIERGAFFSGFGGKTILIGDISDGGRTLTRIFVKEKDDAGRSIILTAERGDLRKQSDFSLVLQLHNGIRSETTANGDATRAMTFDQLDLPLESIAPDPFRPRGEKESELTFTELVRFYFNTPSYLDIEDITAELHERLVRTVSILFLPFLAFPVGISSRRTSKSLRMIVGVLFLIFYYEVLQFGEAMVRRQALGPIPALWVPCAIFAACSLWLFWVADRKPGQDPLAHLFDGLSTIGTWFRRLLPRRLPKVAE